MRILVACIAGLIVSAAFAMPSAAIAKVRPTVSPSKPIVDDSITVRFKTDRTLKPGYHYEAALFGARGFECSYLVSKASRRRPAKGRTMSFVLHPHDDDLHEAFEWCLGKASVSIFMARSDRPNDPGVHLGTVHFRFFGKP